MKRLLSIFVSITILISSVSVALSFIVAADSAPTTFEAGCYDEISDTVTYYNNNTSNQQQIIAHDSKFSEYAVKNGNIQAKIADGSVGNWVYNNGIANGAFTYWGRTYKKVYSEYGGNTNVANGGAASLTYSVKASTRIEMPICMPTDILFMLENFRFEFSSDNGTTWNVLTYDILATDTYQMYYPFTRTLCGVKINADGLFRISFPTQAQMNSNEVKNFNSGAMNNGSIYMIPPAAFTAKEKLTAEKYDEITEQNVSSNGYIDNSKTKFANVSDNIYANKLTDTKLNLLDTESLFGRAYGYVYTIGENTTENKIEYSVCKNTLVNIPIGMMKDFDSLYDSVIFEFSTNGKDYSDIKATNISYTEKTGLEFSNETYAKGSIRNYAVRILQDGFLRIILPATEAINTISSDVSGSIELTKNGAVFMVPAYAVQLTKSVLSIGDRDVLNEELYKQAVVSDRIVDNDLTVYADIKGSVCGALVDNWTLKSLKNTEFYGSAYTHVYTPNCYDNSTPPSITYKLNSNTKLQFAIGMISAMSSCWDDFKIEYSADGEIFGGINAENITYSTQEDVAFSTYEYTVGDIRTYSVDVVADGFVKITFPDVAKLSQIAKEVNAEVYTRTGSVFVVPAVAVKPDEEAPVKEVLGIGERDILNEELYKQLVVSDRIVDNALTVYADIKGSICGAPVDSWTLKSLKNTKFYGSTYTHVYTPNCYDNSTPPSITYRLDANTRLKFAIGMISAMSGCWDDFKIEYSADGKTYGDIASENISYTTEEDIAFSTYEYTVGDIRTYSVDAVADGFVKITFPDVAKLSEIAKEVNAEVYTRSGSVFIVPAIAVDPNEAIPLKEVLAVGGRDVLNEELYNQAVVSDRIVDNDLTIYADIKGSICGAIVDNWTLKSLKDTEFYGSTYTYVYTPNCFDNNTPPSITYRLKADSSLVFAIGMISAMKDCWDDFKIEYSADGKTYGEIASENMSYTLQKDVAFSSYEFTVGDIRTYSIEIIQDGFVKITFPDVAKLSQIAKEVNAQVYTRSGSVFIVPAAVFESNRNKSYLAAKAGQNIVGVSEDTVTVSALIDIATLKDNLLMQNMYAKYFMGEKEVTDYSTKVKSGLKIKCYADGGTQYIKDYLFAEYSVSLSLSNEVLITIKDKLTNGAFDEINAESAALGDRYTIGSDAFSAFAVYNGTVIARPIEGSWTFRDPNASDMFTVLGKEYTHVYFANRVNGDRSLMYSVAAGTKVRIPVGVATDASSLFDEFKYTVSEDGGKTWADAKISYKKYNNYVVGTLGLTYTVRIYSIDFPENALLKITFPDANIARTVLKESTGNDGIDYQGGYYMIPASGWNISEPDDYSKYQKKVMTVGTYDSVSDANFRLNTTDEEGNPKNNGDCCIDNATTEYVWAEGNIKACTTGGWTFAKQYTFSAFDRYYDYVYTQFRAQKTGKRGAIVYRVEQGSELQMPIGCPTEYEHIYDAFEFLWSPDGDNWQKIPASQLSYESYTISQMSTLGYQETIRTYTAQIVNDGYLKVIFPDVDFMFESLKNLNNSKNFCDSGSVFICPAASFESVKGVKLELKDDELYTKLGTDSITVYQEASNKITVAEFISKFKCYNSYLKLFYADGSEVTDENDFIDSSMAVKLISRGSVFDEDNTVKRIYTLIVNTVDKLIKPVVTSKNSQVYINDITQCIEVEYPSESPVSIERLLTMLDYKYLSYKLVDSDGNAYTSTASTVGQDTVYLRFYTNGCPYARDGIMLYEYELMGLSETEEMSLSSLDLQKAVIDYDMKIIYFEDGLTTAQLLSILRITGAKANFYTAPDSAFNTTLITDNNTELKSGMALELQIGSTAIYYELIPYSEITSQKTVVKKTQYTVTTPGAPSDRPLIIGIIAGSSAFVILVVTLTVILILKKKKRKKQNI